eukprot:13866871-Alexandrium_andersonii.AAC.1
MCIRDSVPEAHPARPPALFATRFGICTNNAAECTSPELWGPVLRPSLDPCSSSFERRRPFCNVRIA